MFKKWNVYISFRTSRENVYILELGTFYVVHVPRRHKNENHLKNKN